MTDIFIEVPWTTQPPVGTPIDLSSPFAEQLIVAYNGASGAMDKPHNLMRPSFPAAHQLDSQVGARVTPWGLATAYAGNDINSTTTLADSADLALDENTTVLIRTTSGAPGSYSAFGTSSGDSNFQAHLPYGSTVYWDWQGATNRVTWGGYSAVDGELEVWIFTAGPRGREIWYNGVKVGSNAVTANRGAISGNIALNDGSAGIGHEQDVLGFFVVNKQWGENLIADFFANNWQIFEPEYIPVFTAAAAAAVGGPYPSSIHRNPLRHSLNR